MSIPPITNSRRLLESWIFKTLRFLNAKPRKKLSQVFLVDPKPLLAIAHTLRAFNADKIIEIGAGLGTLTAYIAEIVKPHELLAIEIDERFAPILSMVQHAYSSVNIVIGDALRILPATRGIDFVVGNLPYYITSDLLIAIGQSNARIAIVTVQREVGERLLSSPGSDNYGKLTVFIRTLFTVEELVRIPSTAFKPVPEVDSVVLVLKRIRPYDATIARLEKLTKCVFSYRRKLLHKALISCLGERASKCLAELGDLDWKRLRVFEASPELFLRITCICVENQLNSLK